MTWYTRPADHLVSTAPPIPTHLRPQHTTFDFASFLYQYHTHDIGLTAHNMFGRQAGVVSFTACALGASAFLIPATISNDEAGALTINSPAALNAKQLALQLPCSECAFASKNEEQIDDVEEGLVWIQGGANSVVVNFTISEDGERLDVNGETIYPMNYQAERLLAQRIYVNQVPSGSSVEDIEMGTVRTTPLEVTGSGVSVLSEEIVSPEGLSLIPIKYTIFDLEMQPVSLDAIEVKLLKTEAGELFIAHAEAVEQARPRPDDFFGPPPEGMPEDFLFPGIHDHHKERPGPHSHKEKECNMLPTALCKFRNMVEDKIMGMRKHGWSKGDCQGLKGGKMHGGKLPTHIRPHFLRPDQDGARPHHHGRPHHMRPHANHHGHHKHHFMHSFTRGLAAVLIPTMAGVAVGMAVSLVGLLVGRLIGFLWIKLYRGGRRGYESIRLEEEPAEGGKLEIEKSTLIIEEEREAEELPAYELAPSYDETVKETK